MHSLVSPSPRRLRPLEDPVFQLHERANARRAEGGEVIDATLGVLLGEEGELVVLPTAARAMQAVSTAEWARYAPIGGRRDFLEAVADHLWGGAALPTEWMGVASPGGTGAVRLAVTTFTEPGDAVLTTSSHWAPYDTLCEEHQRTLVTFPMFDAEGRFDLEALGASLTALVRAQGRALLILNDPLHNPTGFSLSASDWAQLRALLEEIGARAPVSLLLDCAYESYAPETARAALQGLLTLAPHVRVLVAWSASKQFTFYGLRVGALIGIAPDPTERARLQGSLNFSCRGTWSNCNHGGMVAATALLTDPRMRVAVAAERGAWIRRLRARGALFRDAAREAGVAHLPNDGGFFVTVPHAAPHAACAALEKARVFVAPQPGGLRLALCAVRGADIPFIVERLAEL